MSEVTAGSQEAVSRGPGSIRRLLPRLVESPLHGMLLVLALATAVRIVHLYQASSNPLFDYPVGTARSYAAGAGTAPDGGEFITAPAPPGPLIEVSPYARFYAFSLAAGGGHTPVLIANHAAGVAACLLVYGVACALFTPPVALAAGLGAAFHGPLLHFGAELTPVAWVAFLVLLLAYAMVRPGRTGVRLAAAAALALLALTEAVAWQAPQIPGSPGQYLANIYYLLQGVELLPDLDPYRDGTGVASALLWHRGLAFPMGVVVPLGAVGLLGCVRSQRRPAGLSGIAVLLGLLLLGLAALAPDGRHRLPLALLLLPFAASALLRGFPGAGRRSRALLFLVLLLAANAGLAAPSHLAGQRQHDYWTGVAYAEKRMYSHAWEAFDRVLAREPGHGEALLAGARVAARDGQVDRALLMYDAFLRENPGSSGILYEMGKTFAAADRFDEAAGVFERARAAGDSSVVLLGALGHARYRGGDTDGAADAYLAAVRARPDSIALRYRLAHAYEAGQRLDQAIEQYRLLLKGSPARAEFHARLGELLLFQEEARAGSIYLERNETTRQAEEHLRAAVSLQPGLEPAHRALAMLLSKQRRYDEAIARFERVRELNPGDHELHRLIANLHERAGNPGEASRQFDIFRRLQREMEIQRRAEEKARELARELGR